MKLKLLLLSMFISVGLLSAQQDTIRSLVFSEFQAEGEVGTYVEFTNMGDEPIDLGAFKFGKMTPWGQAIYDVWNDPWVTSDYFFLPSHILQPGESWVMTIVRDFGPEQYRKKVPGFEGQEREGQPEMWDIADLLIHDAEVKGDETDSVTTTLGTRQGGEPYEVLINWRGRSAFFIEQHLNETDSVVIDQVSGVFDDDGQNQDVQYSVAGVEGAVANSTLVRKFSVKQGNLDFANARGIGLDDSEWMPIPEPEGKYRDLPWTIGNHGPYNLDENTLESDVIDVDFANKTLTVPWGIRRGDGIMRNMKKKPGVYWDYRLNDNVEDSLSFAVHTGDKLIVYVCGNDLDVDSFQVIAAEPTADATTIVPVSDWDSDGGYQDDNADGILTWPRITEHDSGMDTISGNWYGIPYGTRVDSLLERLEKPSNASWEIIWVDGVDKRADFSEGDIIRVTSESGQTHDYYIQVQPFQPSHNALLASITWPDIPDFYRGIFGWVGDTIPGFNEVGYNYRVQVPFDVDGIPALQAKPQDLNATVEVKRATSLSGTVEDRTVEFKVTAEDDSVSYTYSVELVKELTPQNVQPFTPDPFLSEIVFWDQWTQSFYEVCNPGNQPLDLSNYMFVCIWSADPAGATQHQSGEDNWMNRYDRYIPGYKWVNEAQWAITPAYVEQDLNINPIVQPGDVFVMGQIRTDRMLPWNWWPDYPWNAPKALDVQFNNHTGNAGVVYANPWGEPVGSTIGKHWRNSHFYIFEILNDSIKLGLKPANDPNDFELVEIFGMPETSDWVIGGEVVPMISNHIRLPEHWEGDKVASESFGTSWEDSEWRRTDWAYWQAQNVGWPMELLNITNDLGQHFFNPPTHYVSKVSSVVYKVSEGYSWNEEIRGPQTGTTVAGFMANIIKADEGQTLKVMSTADGSELAMDALLSMNDTLVVLSADSTNTTKYRLDVTEEGLSSNAVLTSNRYTVEIVDEPAVTGAESGAADGHLGTGTISGFEYGTQIQTVISNVTVPAGASLSVINGEGAYVALTALNFDTAYVAVTVSDNVFFEVVAENGTTTILYQLIPQAAESDAFITSDLYSVDQRDLLVEYVPGGTSVMTFMSNIIPSRNATVKVIDKFGMEKAMDKNVVQDDRVVVTSPDGTVQTVYFISMLASEYVPPTTYLAYVTSNVYSVDQLDYVISGASGQTDLSTFLSRINPAMGATVSIVDKDGNTKNTGDLDDGDMLKVVSADGKFENMYALELNLTSADEIGDTKISVYPNPTTGRVNVAGVEPGGRIQVFNSTGANIRDFNIQRSVETVDLEDHPAGMYLIIVRDAEKMVARYKVLRK